MGPQRSSQTMIRENANAGSPGSILAVSLMRWSCGCSARTSSRSASSWTSWPSSLRLISWLSILGSGNGRMLHPANASLGAFAVLPQQFHLLLHLDAGVAKQGGDLGLGEAAGV